MNHAFVLVLPDRQGELVEVERVLASCGLYVGRASFNKVIDVHTLFIEVEGPEEEIARAERALRARNMLVDQARMGSVQLVELDLPDTTGSLLPVLELIGRYGLNITYLNVRGWGEDGSGTAEIGKAARTVEESTVRPIRERAGDDGSEEDPNPLTHHVVRCGLYVDDQDAFERFVEEANAICPARVLAYDKNLEVLDNNLFYVSYVRGLGERFHFTPEQESTVLVNMNRIVQNLERTSAGPYKPFTYLGEFAETIDRYRGQAYLDGCRVSRFTTASGVAAMSLEPPAGCTSWVFDLPGAGPGGRDEYFVIDCGYACYREEFAQALRRELPDWDERYHLLFLTHGDVDHAGCCDLFDRALAVEDVLDNFALQAVGERDWREQNPLFLPYNRITNILTGYEPPALEGFDDLGRRDVAAGTDIARVLSVLDGAGAPVTLDVGPFHFEVWQGAGGHVRGETVLIEREQRICVSGDIFINVHQQTKVQRAFNLISPYLMTSVDSEPDLARSERKELFEMLDGGTWQVMGGHGPLFLYEKRS